MAEKILIEGGRPLRGEVAASGAKNAALPLMASSLLVSGPLKLHNVPDLRDVDTMCRLLSYLGARCDGDQTLVIDAAGVTRWEAPYDLVKTMRASVLVLGPLVARFGRARVSQPGGCAIGARPINRHLAGLEAMGARVRLEHGYVQVEAEHGLNGAEIVFEAPTVTGTENLMMAATLARGETVLVNAAMEPEVADLAEALVTMGARITGAGTPEIRIEGVAALSPVEYTVLPDRIEAATYLVAAGITGGDITVRHCVPKHIRAVVKKLEKAGLRIQRGEDWIRATGGNGLRAVDVITDPYPGFPTDMQAQFMALMTLAEGQSTITETIFEQRFMHVPELNRMGADITLSERRASVRGVPFLSGAPVMATDLRASASLVLAGLGAREGITEISRVYHLDRGYERIDDKLAALGARIWRSGG